jgi:hypothetical protein
MSKSSAPLIIGGMACCLLSVSAGVGGYLVFSGSDECANTSANNYTSDATSNAGCTFGCANVEANNYTSTGTSNVSCTFDVIEGCLDTEAINYLSTATSNVGCTYACKNPVTQKVTVGHHLPDGWVGSGSDYKWIGNNSTPYGPKIVDVDNVISCDPQRLNNLDKTQWKDKFNVTVPSDDKISVKRIDDGIPSPGTVNTFTLTQDEITAWEEAGNTNWGGWGQELEINCEVCTD